LFIVPASSFDNVKGKFPIGFFIWDTKRKVKYDEIQADVYSATGQFEGKKSILSYDNLKNINDWLRPTWKKTENRLAFLTCNSNDFQNANGVFIQLNKGNETSTYYKPVTSNNLIQSSIYFTVRKCIAATWLNDRDQFLYPNDGWQTDTEFQNDCLTYTLFSNNIQSKYGTNHWIPFTEMEVNPREAFESHFMTDFLKGKIAKAQPSDLFDAPTATKKQPLIFSDEAKLVFDAGKKLWQYYHSQADTNVNASLYDIREHFQGRNDAGKMNNKSEDEDYMKCIKQLREQLQVLETKLQPKVYEYGFLKA
jgi:hypothetical protein